jgi:hypothetical protein
MSGSNTGVPVQDGLLPVEHHTVPKQSVVLLGRTPMDMSTARSTFRQLWREEQNSILPSNIAMEKNQYANHFQNQLHYDQRKRQTAKYVQEQAMVHASSSSSSDASFDPTKVLEEWGIDGSLLLGGGQHSLSTSSSSSSSRYTGRPLYGATSAALYLSAEHEVGYPPYQRNQYTYPEGLQASSAMLISSLPVHTIEQTKNELKRPIFPDRQYPIGDKSVHIGSGMDMLRDLATANMNET